MFNIFKKKRSDGQSVIRQLDASRSSIDTTESFPGSTMKGEKTTGLRTIFRDETRSSPDNIVTISIHGAGGQPMSSWTHRESGFCWIRDGLIRSQRICASLTYGYNSSSDFTSEDHADWLLDALLRQLEWIRGPIIFLAIDMGGLILSLALQIALTRHAPACKQLVNSVSGIVFFNTPHLGSENFRWLKYAARIVNASSRKGIESLAKGDEPSVVDALRHLAKSTVIVNAYATRPPPLNSKSVLSRKEIELGGDIILPLDLPMADVAKYTSFTDPNFERIFHLIDTRIPRIHAMSIRNNTTIGDILDSGEDLSRPSFELPSIELARRSASAASLQELEATARHAEPRTRKNQKAESNRDPEVQKDVKGKSSADDDEFESDFESARSFQLDPKTLSDLGLFQLSSNLEISPKIDIIAVHSVKGHYLHSWQARNSEKIWIRDFLEYDIPEARICSFGWNAALFENSHADLRDVATQLLIRIDQIRQMFDTVGRPLLFLGHGVGGILIKQALIMAKENPEYNAIFKSTKGIFFFATPHRGIDVEQYCRTLLAQNVTLDSDHAFIKSLSRNSETTQEISFRFRNLMNDIRIVTFYELMASSVYDNARVVERSDATMDAANERQIPIDATHTSICKFESEKDPSYQTVVSEIARLADSTYGWEHVTTAS